MVDSVGPFEPVDGHDIEGVLVGVALFFQIHVEVAVALHAMYFSVPLVGYAAHSQLLDFLRLALPFYEFVSD